MFRDDAIAMRSLMKKSLRPNKRLYISQLLWEKRLDHKYMPHAGYMGNGEEIHLMLGVNGAGINHLARLVSQALYNSRYIDLPLAKFEPKLTLSNRGYRLGIPYHKNLTGNHPMIRTYRIHAERNLLERKHIECLLGNEMPQDILLIMKEVHGLLATEALLRELKCHVLFYISDPVILAEQIFSREGLDTPYLELESAAVMDPRFLKRFFPHDIRTVLHAYKLINRSYTARQRRVLMKIFTIALIQHMFRMLAARYPESATVVDYGVIQSDPKQLDYPLVNWLGTNGVERANDVLNTATFTPDGQTSMRWKSSWPELLTAFDILSAEDVSAAYQVILDHKLMRDEGKREIWSEKCAV
jgi:hypothetical protein